MARSKLIFLFFFSMMVFGCAHPQFNFSTERIVYLTHPFDRGTIYWPTSPTSANSPSEDSPVIALPMKFKGESGGSLRIVAILP
ncbi:MAG: hypothetical protein QF619_08795 [Candidatus Binatia bacterium]|nr:hypothetical protein [Candidatus Binatia bacterium]